MIEIKELTEKEIPWVCVPIVAEDADDILLQALQAQQSSADIVEWRADYFENVQTMTAVKEVLTQLREILKEKVILFTFRTQDEGGQQEISLGGYKALCQGVAASGMVDFMDLELQKVEFLGRKFVQELKETGVKIIMSNHDFDHTPEDSVMILRYTMMTQYGADIGKIAGMPQNLNDVLRMIGIIQKARGLTQLPLVAISMGDLGKISRISSHLAGSVLTFASLEETSAPGQIPIETMRGFLEELALSNK